VASNIERENSELDGLGDLTEAELAYMAGFLDGEGSISIYQNNASYSLDVTLYNTDRRTLRWLEQRLRSLSPEEGTDTRNDGRHNRDTYSLRLRRQEEVREFLEAVQPYVVTKQPHVENALTFLDLVMERENYHYTDEQKQQMKEHYERQRELNE